MATTVGLSRQSPYLTQPSNTRLRRPSPARGTGVAGVRALGRDSGEQQTPSGRFSVLSSTAAGLRPSHSQYGVSPLVARSLDTGLMGGVGGYKGTAMPTFLIPSVETSYKESIHGVEGCADKPSSYVTIVFDLDETLCNNRRAGKALLRPGAIDLLKHLRSLSTPELFVEIILWTASMDCVAKPVVQRLDPTGTIFNQLIYRDRRWYRETGYTKDLRRLGRAMNRTIIIENSPQSVQNNRKHSILVRDFIGGYGGTNDQDLVMVKEILTGWITELKEALARESTSQPEGDQDGGENAERPSSLDVSPSGKAQALSSARTLKDGQFATSVGIGIVEWLARYPGLRDNEIIHDFRGNIPGRIVPSSTATATTAIAYPSTKAPPQFPGLGLTSRPMFARSTPETRRAVAYR